MDSILPALLAVTILVLASLMIGRSSFSSFNVLSDSWQNAEERSVERVRSDITITSITDSGARRYVDVVVRNDGDTPIVDFSRMDVVVQYVADTGQNIILWVPFSSSGPPPNTWTVISINNDVIDPGVLNSGESMTLQIQLEPRLENNASHWLQVTTELGISASSFFTT